jgi:hypothetical protein
MCYGVIFQKNEKMMQKNDAKITCKKIQSKFSKQKLIY